MDGQLVKFKRDLVSLYFLLAYIKLYSRKCYASCFVEAAKIELLESHISGLISSVLFKALKNKYNASECSPDDPFRTATKNRFNSESGRLFLRANLIMLKPWISDKEKGVLLIKYTEIMNALPFLFDIDKLQERYDLVLEPSWESPYQMYCAFIPTKSGVFVQSLSIREQNLHKEHGFQPVPVCAGDWVNVRNFYPDDSIAKKYDFCVIANFIPAKRYPYLFAALSKYWKGDLKFAILASSHIGENGEWMKSLLAQYNLTGKADLYIEVPPAEVNKILNQSYCHVLASIREGANKANFESMSAGTPVVVHRDHVGFPNWKFKPPLVQNYTDGASLVTAIGNCKNVGRQQVSVEAHNLIGSKRATFILNDEIKRVTTAAGDVWTRDLLEKVNNVHAFYYNPDDVNNCIQDYHFLESIVLDKSNYSAERAIERFGKKTPNHG